MKKTRINKALVFVLDVLFAAAWANLAAAPDKLKPGQKAPEFTLKNVMNGEKVSLSDFVDKKIVIVHFWKAK